MTDDVAGLIFMTTGVPQRIIDGEAVTPLDWFNYARAVEAHVKRSAPEPAAEQSLLYRMAAAVASDEGPDDAIKQEARRWMADHFWRAERASATKGEIPKDLLTMTSQRYGDFNLQKLVDDLCHSHAPHTTEKTNYHAQLAVLRLIDLLQKLPTKEEL